MLARTPAKMPGEEALWRYKRGAARAALGPAGRRPRRPERDVGPRRAGLGPGPGERSSSPAWPSARGDHAGAAGRRAAGGIAVPAGAAIRRASTMREAWRGAPVAGKVKTWVWVVVGIGVICVLAARRRRRGRLLLHVAAHRDASGHAGAGGREFEAVKVGFRGQKPLDRARSEGRLRPRATPDRAAAPDARVPEQLT